jgi:glycosyltransferase involved in cell wall biosynthesis
MCPEDNGATRERGRARLNVSQDEFLLAFFGYIDRNKGIETLFKAIQLVSANGHNVRVVMIGGGRGSTQAASNQRARTVLAYEQEMLRCPEQLGIGTKVIWLNGYDSTAMRDLSTFTPPTPAYCRSTRVSP